MKKAAVAVAVAVAVVVVILNDLRFQKRKVWFD